MEHRPATRLRKVSIMSLNPQLRNRMVLPMIAAPMFTVSGPDLVVACCEALPH